MKNFKKMNVSPIALRVRAYVILKEKRGGLKNITNEEIDNFFVKVEPHVEALMMKGVFVKKAIFHKEPSWSPCDSVYDPITKVNKSDYILFEKEIEQICKD